ncbi:MAG: TonB-dependent receptor domain-containing protein [Marinobacter sp.]
MISLTPLIDVVFIVLVFIMLAPSFMDWKPLALDTSAAVSEPAPSEQAPFLAAIRGDELLLNSEAESRPDLIRRAQTCQPLDQEASLLGQDRPGPLKFHTENYLKIVTGFSISFGRVDENQRIQSWGSCMHSEVLAPSRPKKHHTRVFNLLALSIAAAIGTAAPLPALSQTSESGAATAQASEQRQYNIQGGPLDAVLNRFALEAGIDLSVSSEFTQGKTSPGLNGQYSVNEALRQLLMSSGLSYRFTGVDTVTLERVAVGSADRPQWLSPLVITPPLEGAVQDQERYDRVEPTSRLTREQFEHLPSARRLSDVVDRMPGVFFRGPVGVNRDIKLRGMDKEYNRFEVDGVQLPGVGGREFRVNRLSPQSVDTIELLHNPGASYESDGIAGRIVTQSRPIPDQFTLSGAATTGGVDALDGSFRQSRLALGDKVSETFGYNLFLDSARVPRHKDKSKTTTDGAGDFEGREVEDEQVVEDELNLSADFRWSLGSGKLHLKPRFDRQDSTKDKVMTKTHAVKVPEKELEVGGGEDWTGGGSLEYVHDYAGGARWKSAFSYFKTESEQNKTKQKLKAAGDSFALDRTEEELIDLEDNFWQLKSDVKLPLDYGVAQQLGFGIQARSRSRTQEKSKIEIRANGDRTDKTEPGDNFEITEDLLAVYLEDEFFLSDRFSVTPGLRAEHVNIDSRSDSSAAVTSNRTDFNPSLHTRYAFNKQLVLKAAASRKLNRPKFEQMVPFRKEKGDRFEEGNPDVTPASAWTYDLGLTYNTKHLLFSVLAFHKDVDNVIDTRNTGQQVDDKDLFRVGNIGDGWVQGIELEQRLNLGLWSKDLNGVVLWANQGFYDSEMTLDETGEKQPFDEQRDYVINLGADYRLPNQRTLITLAGKYLGDLEKVKGPDEVEVEQSRFLLDIGLRHQLTKRVTLTADVINVLDPDQDKKLFNGDDTTFDTETPGRVFYIGIKGEF